MLDFIKPSKGQRILLYLFFMAIIIGTLFFHPIIYFVQKAHSEMILRQLNNYEIQQYHGIEIYYKENTEEYTDNIAQRTHQFIQKVDQNFQREQSKAFKMVVYPNAMDLNADLRVSSGERTLGAYYGGNIFLLSPSQYPESETPIENVILHEYTHLLVDDITRGNHPVWLTEGIALYQEYLITGYQWGQGDLNIIPYSLGQLEKNFDQIDTYRAYHSSFYRVMYLEENFRGNFIPELLHRLGRGMEYKAAIETIFEKDMEEMEDGFMLWYQRKNYGKL